MNGTLVYRLCLLVVSFPVRAGVGQTICLHFSPRIGGFAAASVYRDARQYLYVHMSSSREKLIFRGCAARLENRSGTGGARPRFASLPPTPTASDPRTCMSKNGRSHRTSFLLHYPCHTIQNRHEHKPTACARSFTFMLQGSREKR